MTGNTLPPEPPPVYLPEPQREPELRPQIPARRATADDLKFDFPADTLPEAPKPAPRSNNFSRFVFWVIMAVIGIVGVQSGSPIPLVIFAVAAVVFGKRWRRRR